MRLGVTLLLLVLSATIHAHDLWLDREAGAYVLHNGHRHGGHEGAETIPYAPSFVKRARCYGSDGRVVEPPLGDSPFRMEGACAALMVDVSSGYWGKTPFETLNLPRNEVGQVVASWRSLEAVKRIDQWREAFSSPLGDGLEIVPRENPLALGPGDKLHLTVVLAGEPVKGAVVSYDGDPRGATDAEGRINIRLRHAGFQLLAASFSRSLDSPEADREVFTSVLNFELSE